MRTWFVAVSAMLVLIGTGAWAVEADEFETDPAPKKERDKKDRPKKEGRDKPAASRELEDLELTGVVKRIDKQHKNRKTGEVRKTSGLVLVLEDGQQVVLPKARKKAKDGDAAAVPGFEALVGRNVRVKGQGFKREKTKKGKVHTVYMLKKAESVEDLGGEPGAGPMPDLWEDEAEEVEGEVDGGDVANDEF